MITELSSKERAIEVTTIAELIQVLQELPADWSVGSGVEYQDETPYMYLSAEKPGRYGLTVIIEDQ